MAALITGPYMPCKGQLSINGGADILHVTRVRRRRRATTEGIVTSDTNCEEAALHGSKSGGLDFTVLLSEDEDIYDVLVEGDEVVLDYLHDRSKGAAGMGWTHELVIEEISDETEMAGNRILVDISARDIAAPVRINTP